MNLKLTLIAASALTLAALAPAQGWQGRGGGMMRMMGAGTGSYSFLLQRDDVREDLKLTDEQKTKMSDLRDKIQEDMRSAFQDANGDREVMRKAMQATMKRVEDQIQTILTADQYKRLKEIGIQLAGNGAVQNPDVQTSLGLTEAQKTKIKDLQEKQQEAQRSLIEKMRNQELDRDAARESMEKNVKILNDEIGKVLTDDQKAKLKEMGGKTFVEKDPS